MDEMYGLHPTSDEVLMWPENLMISDDYNQYHYHSSIHSDADHHYRVPMFGSDELGFHSSVASHESPSVDVQNQRDGGDDDEEDSAVIKAKISSHPCYPKLIDAYIDCQKIGAPPEVVYLLDGMRREKDLCKQDGLSTCFGVDPQLDEFMETYCDILVKYKSDLSRPFDEATSFLSDIETQLFNLNNDEAAVSSDEEMGIEDALTKREDRQLKEKLLRLYGSHISNLRLEFSKKKKKGKLPKEARQSLLGWWNSHSKWPYPTEADKIELAESTGLDQKQINNWFINQRKRHWKSPENMHLDAANFGPKE